MSLAARYWVGAMVDASSIRYPLPRFLFEWALLEWVRISFFVKSVSDRASLSRVPGGRYMELIMDDLVSMRLYQYRMGLASVRASNS